MHKKRSWGRKRVEPSLEHIFELKQHYRTLYQDVNTTNSIDNECEGN